MGAPSELALTFLGQFKVLRRGQLLTRFESDKVRALLVFLAVERHSVHSRDALAALLWPGFSEDSARVNLRHTLHQLRVVLGEKETDAPILIVTRQTVQFQPAFDAEIDVEQFGARLADVRAHAHADLVSCPHCQDTLRQAVALHNGEFLSNLSLADCAPFEEWRRLKQEQLQIGLSDALHTLAEMCLAAQRHEEAVTYARRQIELEPWREDAHRQVMRAYAASGQRDAAMAQYALMRKTLAAEIGVAPSPETETLYARIKAGQYAPQASAERPVAPGPPGPPDPHDWGDIPAADIFHGRANELAQLRQWLVQDHCRFVSILGIGGMGKTTLAAAAVRAAAGDFDLIIWRSLLNAPPLDEIMRGWLQTLSQYTLATPPDSPDEQLRLLLNYLRQRRCLLVLDNVESILQPGGGERHAAGEARPGYEAYARLFARLADSDHRSCLLITSREQPNALARIGRDRHSVRQLPVGGLDLQASVALLHGNGLRASSQDEAALVRQYSGNPLALQLVANTIVDYFDGDVTAFQREEGVLFDGIRTVLDQQFERLSELERDILVWLAIEREPVSAKMVQANLARPAAFSELLSALDALQARALLEKTADGLTLQNVVIEYLTERLTTAVCAEIGGGAPLQTSAWLHRFALMKAQAKEFVRQSQSRLILRPVAERIEAVLGADALIDRFAAILEMLRGDAAQRNRSYAAGNVLNLALHAGLDLRRLRFSHLTVREAFLREHSLAGGDLAGADLTGAMFADSFSACHNIAYNEASATLAASTTNGEVRLWTMDGGQPLTILRGHAKVVWALAGNPRLTQYASGGEDGSVRLWQRVNAADNIWTGRVLHQSDATVRSVAFHPSGEWVACAGDDRLIRVFHARSGTAVLQLLGHSNYVTSIEFSPDGGWLASCADDRTVRLWRLPDLGMSHGETRDDAILLHELPPQAPSFWSLAFAPDGRTLASGTMNGQIWVWTLADRALRHSQSAHAGAITTLSFSKDGAILASAGEDASIRLWNADSWQLIRQLQGHDKRVSAIAFHSNTSTLASASLDNTVRVWNIERGLASQVQAGQSIGMANVCFGRDDRTLITATSDGRISTWALPDLEQPQTVQPARGHLTGTIATDVGFVASMAVDHEHHHLATGGHDHAVRIWDARDGSLRHVFSDHQHIVFGVALSPDGQTLASASIDLTARIWDIQSGRCLHVLTHELSPGLTHNGTWSVAYSPDGRLLAVGYTDGAIVLWSVPEAMALATLRGHTNWVRGLTFSRDGARLVSCGNDGAICVWDVAARTLVRTALGHADWVMGVDLDASGSLAASCSQDQTVRIWQLDAPAQEPLVIRGHENGAYRVTFSPSGRYVASVDGSVRIWRVSDGKLTLTLRPPGLYEGTNLTGAIGLSAAQRSVVAQLGAIVS